MGLRDYMYLVCVSTGDARGRWVMSSAGGCRADGAMSNQVKVEVETDASLDLRFLWGEV